MCTLCAHYDIWGEVGVRETCTRLATAPSSIRCIHRFPHESHAFHSNRGIHNPIASHTHGWQTAKRTVLVSVDHGLFIRVQP